MELFFVLGTATSDPFLERQRLNRELVDALNSRLESVIAGGPPAAREKYLDRGKLMVRDRVNLLLDPHTPFIELSPMAAYDQYDNQFPSAGIVTGIGLIHGMETVIIAKDATVKDQSTIFLGGPPLVKAATGEVVSSKELGGAMVHASVSGVADHLAGNDQDALQKCRDIFETIQVPNRQELDREPSKEPLYDIGEIYGLIPRSNREPVDVRELIARLVDAVFDLAYWNWGLKPAL